MKLNYGEHIFFQDDNSHVHETRKVANFLKSSQIYVINVWKLFSIQFTMDRHIKIKFIDRKNPESHNKYCKRKMEYNLELICE